MLAIFNDKQTALFNTLYKQAKNIEPNISLQINNISHRIDIILNNTSVLFITIPESYACKQSSIMVNFCYPHDIENNLKDSLCMHDRSFLINKEDQINTDNLISALCQTLNNLRFANK